MFCLILKTAILFFLAFHISGIQKLRLVIFKVGGNISPKSGDKITNHGAADAEV